MKLISIAAAVLVSAASVQAKNVANNELPFKYEVTKLDADKRNGAVFTIVTIKIHNGKNALPSVTFHCEAKSNKGRTWDVAATVTHLEPLEVRTARLVNDGDTSGEFSDPSSVVCEVKAFDGGLR